MHSLAAQPGGVPVKVPTRSSSASASTAITASATRRGEAMAAARLPSTAWSAAATCNEVPVGVLLPAIGRQVVVGRAPGHHAPATTNTMPSPR